MPTIGGAYIVRDGLVLHYDAGTTRSFRGEPTTNLIPNPIDWSDGWFLYYRTTLATTFTTEFNTIGYRFNFQPTWNGIYKIFNLVNSGIYTFSAWFRYLGGTGNNNGATVYISNYGGGDTVVGLDKGKIGVWQRVSHTINVTSPSNVYFFLISYGGTDNGSTDPDWSSWEVTMPQIEQKSYATNFLKGTRGTTVETGGGLIDLSKNNTSGELIGPIFNESHKGSLMFDGTDDIIYIPNQNSINISGDITLHAWVRRNTSSGGVIIHKEVQYTLLLNSNGTLTYADSSVWSYATFGEHGSIPANQFTHIAAVKSGGNVTIYVNSSVIISKSFGSGISQTSSDLYIGSYAGGSAFFNGNISNVAIYNRALSAEEILQNFNATRGRFRV